MKSTLTTQLDLFSAGGDAWLAQHWPAYIRGAGTRAGSPLVIWATTFDELTPGVRRLLVELCVNATRGAFWASIASLARATRASEQATRQRLDRLLASDLVMVKLWTSEGKDGRAKPLGYEFRVIVDEGSSASATADGFGSKRDAGRRNEQGMRCP